MVNLMAEASDRCNSVNEALQLDTAACSALLTVGRLPGDRHDLQVITWPVTAAQQTRYKFATLLAFEHHTAIVPSHLEGF